MNGKPERMLSPRRLVAVALLVSVIFALYGVQLFRVQIVDGEDYAAGRNQGYQTSVSVASSRGEILDRYLNPIVYNATGYAVVFDGTRFPHGSSQEKQKAANDCILSLTALLSSAQESWTDGLPITAAAPYAYVEGRETAVEALRTKLRLQSYATADNCMQALVERYSLQEYTAEQARIVAGVRYAMEQAGFSETVPYTFAEDVSRGTVYVLKETADRYPGVSVETVSVREYTDGTLAPHLIGYVGRINAEEYKNLKDQGYAYNDILGKAGIESAFEAELRGIDGVKTVVRSSTGTIVSEKVTVEPQAGQTVVLTVDSGLQKVAQEALAAKIAQLRTLPDEVGNGHDVKSGSVVLLDVRDGGVLTCASWPGYDVSSFSVNYASIAADPDRPLFNRALNGSFVVGSTVKPGVALAAITEGIVAPNTLIDCTRRYTYFEDFQPNCLGRHGNIAVKTAISKSCNYYFYEVGRLLGGAALCQYYSLYGFGTRTGVEVSESEGIFRTPDNYVSAGGVGWTPGTSLQNAIGQVSQLTPMQLASYCMMIANNGVRYKTHFLYSLRSYDGVSETLYQPEVAATVKWDEKAIAAVKAGMLECVKTGTASKYFGGISYTLAAKTGTAQTGVSTWSDHGCFIGYAPADNPEVAIAVIMERGKSAAASEVARVVLDAYFEQRSTVNVPDGFGTLLP